MLAERTESNLVDLMGGPWVEQMAARLAARKGPPTAGLMVGPGVVSMGSLRVACWVTSLVVVTVACWDGWKDFD